ncbi:MAG: response regulator transcription factor [Ardenticatenaceae bacterium]|nr:response regulator transcription factor [Ardenticatenaceae bacterium]
MPNPIRILVADDHPLFRAGVVASLSRQPNFTVIAEASSGEEAYTLAAEHLPDILLLDITMPGEGGIAAAQRIAATFPIVRIIMLTVSEDQDNLLNALKAGAKGYVLKGVSARELATAVRTVADGDVYISAQLAGGILFEMTHSPVTPKDPFSELTERERQILTLLADGLTNREIGGQLFLAEKTIKHYMTNILQKLQVRSRVEAALLAQKHGLTEDEFR